MFRASPLVMENTFGRAPRKVFLESFECYLYFFIYICTVQVHAPPVCAPPPPLLPPPSPRAHGAKAKAARVDRSISCGVTYRPSAMHCCRRRGPRGSSYEHVTDPEMFPRCRPIFSPSVGPPSASSGNQLARLFPAVRHYKFAPCHLV